MNKTQILDPAFENLVETYINARNRAGASMLEMAVICLKAKEQLKKKKWFEWLEDSRINLKMTQAKKLIAVAKICKQGGQSTDLLNKKGIEETYLLTKIQDDLTREEVAGQIIEADFTVKQTKQVVSIIQNENKTPIEAIKTIQEIKNMPKSSAIKSEKKTVPIEEFNSLKHNYDKLLKEKQELENLLQEKTNKSIENKVETEVQEDTLVEIIDSDEADFTIDEKIHAVVFKGKKIPIPRSLKLIGQAQNCLEIIAVKEAKEKFGLDLS